MIPACRVQRYFLGKAQEAANHVVSNRRHTTKEQHPFFVVDCTYHLSAYVYKDKIECIQRFIKRP